MPHGPASLKGLGESFEPSSATGTGSYAVPLEVPPGFLAPSLSLTYSGGHGKSELGQGWKLSTLQIYRQTDKGAPNFDEVDRFCVSGGGLNDELVLVNEDRRYYRLKNEGAYALLIRDPDEDSWTIKLASGETSFLGSGEESREKARGRTSRWLLDKHVDRFGHWTEYRYFTDRGHVYLDEIAYQLHAAPAYQNTVAFSYEDRPDVFTDYTYGDANTTAQRLASVHMFHGARLVRSYQLGYETALLFSVLASVELTGEDNLKMPKLSFGYLTENSEGGELVTVRNAPPLDALVEGWGELDDVNADGLPDLITTRPTDYRYYENIDGRSFGNARTLRNSPDHDLTEAGVTFADINGDGFRDLVHPQGDHFRYYPGGDIKAGVFKGFLAPVELKTTSDSFLFTASDVKLGDQNQDGRIDLLWQKPGRDSWIISGKDDVLREQPTPELPLDVDFQDSRIELTDFNGDGLLDFVRKEIGLGSSTLWVWYGLGHGEFTSAKQVPGVPKGDPNEFHLRDVNHDGQADLLRLSGSWATVYLNRGSLGFSGARGSFQGLPAASQTLRVLFADMNGNGTNDVVWITKDFKLRYLELSREPFAGLLSRVDNGVGLVTEVAYRSSTEFSIVAKGNSSPWAYPMGVPTPVISEIHTTDSLDVLGLRATETRTTFEYRNGYYDGKEHEFRGFSEAKVTSWGDESHETLVKVTKFHVGLNASTLADEEALKGKTISVVETNSAGDVYSATEQIWDRRWLCQKELPNSPEILPDCDALGAVASQKDRLVAIATSPATLTATFEKTSNPRFTATTTEFDAWGDPTRVTHWGEVTYPGEYAPGGGFEPSSLENVPGDENVTTSVKLHDTGSWLIGRELEQGLQDLQGNVLARTRTYYDDLAYGRARVGLPTRVAQYNADTGKWLDTKRSEYDVHGNEIAHVNAVGDRSELRYDTPGNFLPDQERVQVTAADWVTFHAEYDAAYGEIVRYVDANDEESRVVLDGLGRVVRIFEPGYELPSSKFEYSFGTPRSPVSITRIDVLAKESGKYHPAWTYSDGAGRVRQKKEVAEGASAYLASGWVDYSARQGVVTMFDPFPSATLGVEAPPASAVKNRIVLDAMGRPIRAERPPTADLPRGSYSLTEYYPFETRAYTEKESTLGDLRHPVTTQTDGLGRIVVAHKLNRQGATEQNLAWRVSYDARGSIVGFADPLWSGAANDTRHLRRYTYDALGRLKTIRDPNAGRTDYEFDDINRVVKMTDALGQTQSWEYGRAGRLLVHQVSADARGGAGYRHEYHYDAPAPNSPLQAPAAAHLRGKLSWLEYPTGEEHYSYDQHGRVAEEVQVLWNPGVSSFENQQRDTFRRTVAYRADGLVEKSVAPGGLELNYEYNERGSVVGVAGRLGQWERTVLAGASYDHRGNAVSTTLGNGLHGCTSFNERSELVATVVTKENDCSPVSAGNGGLYNLRYARGYDGLVDSTTDRSEPRAGIDRLDASYEYDSIQQLVKAEDSWGATTFAYDEIQNLVRREVLGTIIDEPDGAFTYGQGTAGPNALTSVGGKSYGYDAAGQMLQYNGYDLHFNAEGQLVEASNVTTGVRLVQHFDDAGERRLALVYRTGKPVEVHRFIAPEYEIHDGEEVWFAGGAAAQAEIVRSRGFKIDALLLDELTQYVNGVRAGPKPLPAEYMDLNGDGRVMDADDLAVARQAYASETRVGGEKLVARYTTADHLGNATIATDSSGDMVSNERFHPYGKLGARAGEKPYRGGYLGKSIEADADLGLQRLGARYYAAALGRWITPDPLIGRNPQLMVSNPIESNLYSYGRNNPIMVMDPLGLAGEEKKDGWGARAGKWLVHAAGDAILWLAGGSSETVCREGLECGAHHVSDAEYAGRMGVVALSAGAGGLTARAFASRAMGAMMGGEAAGAVAGLGNTALDDAVKGKVSSPGTYVENGVVGAAEGAATGVILHGAGRTARGVAKATSKVPSWLRNYCAGGNCPCFVAGTPIDTSSGQVPIETVELGERVGPESAACASLEREGWVEVGLRMAVLSAGVPDELDIRLLRPGVWVVDRGLELGGTTSLSLDELNVSGEAFITSLRAAPALSSGARCPVTGTVRHTSRDVILVNLQRGTPLEVTSHHRFFSADRRDWVPAEGLRRGEHLRARNGVAVVVDVDHTQRPPTEVFNLEVVGEHQYYVGNERVLAHNEYSAEGGTPRRPWKITKEGTAATAQHNKFGTFYKSKSDGLWWSRDQAGHGKSVWKVFDETDKGLQWKADADEFGDFIVGKHKGPTGMFIPWSRLSGGR